MSIESALEIEQRSLAVERLVQQQPEIAGLQSFEHFRSDANDQKTAYIAGEIDNLILHYSALSLEDITALKEPMEQALTTLMPVLQDTKSEALFETIEYRYAELFQMDMARVINSPGASDADKAEARDWFKLTSENLYGKPEAPVFNALAAKSLTPLLEARASDDDLISGLRAELAGMVGEIDDSEYIPYTPDGELVTRIGELVHERFDGLVDHIDDDKTYEVDDLVLAMTDALRKLDDDTDWKVEIAKNSSALAVLAHKKIVEVGENRKPIQGATLKGLVIHEIGVHAGRSITAEQQDWLAAQYGLSGYTNFEESFATALQDAYKGVFKSHGEQYYIAAGLAYGLDNHEPRDFKQVYDIIWRTQTLQKAESEPVTQVVIDKAKSSAFANTLRLFRGTDTNTPGYIYLKDLSYFNGQESAWNFLETVQSQADFDLGFAGKTDLSRQDHRDIGEAILKAKATA